MLVVGLVVVFGGGSVLAQGDDIIMQSSWENPGQVTGSEGITDDDHYNCDDAGKGYDCPGAWTCLDASSTSPDDACKLLPNPWQDIKMTAYNDCDIRVQDSVVKFGNYALEVEWNHAVNTDGMWVLEIDRNDATWLNTIHNEFYISHWIRFSSDWHFVSRWKGLKLHDRDSQALCTGGGLSILNGKNGESNNGYGISGNDNTEKQALFNGCIDSTHGSLTISNYAGYSAGYGSNTCCKTYDQSDIGMNHPLSSSYNQFGPADDASTTDNYWPGTWCYDNSQYVTIGLNQWYQIIYHYKVSDTGGLIEVWIREGDSGILKKVIKLDKNAWDGTAYATSTYDTRCFAPGFSSLMVNNIQLYPYMNPSGDNVPGMKMYVDDFIVATTFDAVKDYGLNTSSSPECSDSIDNDGDGATDFPADTGCTDANDTDETNCGDGVCEGGETEISCAVDCDTSPPLRSNPQPTGTLSSGTTSTTISLDTDETAVCRYSETAGIIYDDMPNTFSTTNSTSHSTQVTGLENGQTYIYYVRCNSTYGIVNDDDFNISFSIDGHKADTNDDGVINMPELMIFIARWTTGDGVTKQEVEEARGIWFAGGVY
ncbi:MAG: hypothetical protein U9M95_04150 [Candidatus Altiarchaeota archaeon]|nr:hypothetical protein [Candidatus Altiarchaeota archaeon]